MNIRRKRFLFMCAHKGKWDQQWRWKGQRIMKQLVLENLYHPADTHTFQLMLRQVIFPPLPVILSYMLLTISRVSTLQYSEI